MSLSLTLEVIHFSFLAGRGQPQPNRKEGGKPGNEKLTPGAPSSQPLIRMRDLG
jgi:hypothetical protein